MNWKSSLIAESGGRLSQADLMWRPDAQFSVDALKEKAVPFETGAASDWRYIPFTTLPGGFEAIDSMNPSSDSVLDFVTQSVLFAKVSRGDDSEIINSGIHDSRGLNIVPYESIGFGPVSQIALALYALEKSILSHDPADGPGPPRTVSVSVGSRLLTETAKLRALRTCLNHLLSLYGMSGVTTKIHAHTSKLDLDSIDEDNNLIRTTLHAVAAVLGSSDFLSIQPWDVHSRGYQNEDAARLALNISRLLKHESYLNKVCDPTHGSFSIEDITSQMSDQAWTLFLDIKDIQPHELHLYAGLIQRLKADRALQLESAPKRKIMSSTFDSKERKCFCFPSWEASI